LISAAAPPKGEKEGKEGEGTKRERKRKRVHICGYVTGGLSGCVDAV